jgi:transcriptional regulator with XRE-family HTH domain
MQGVDTDSTTLKYIAANLARYRNDRGWSYAELARRASIQTEQEKCIAYPTTIKRIEDADNMPSAALVKRLEEALGLKPGELAAEPKKSFKPVMPNAPADVHRPKKGNRPMPKQSA